MQNKNNESFRAKLIKHDQPHKNNIFLFQASNRVSDICDITGKNCKFSTEI